MSLMLLEWSVPLSVLSSLKQTDLQNNGFLNCMKLSADGHSHLVWLLQNLTK